jgi:hypothetical protein
VKLDSLRFEIICFGIIVPVRCHKFVSEYKKKRNETDVLWEDIQQTTEGAMKSEKELR